MMLVLAIAVVSPSLRETPVMKTNRQGTFLEKGFSLLNLLAVIASIVILAALTVGGTNCGVSAERNRTIAAHAVIKSGLEQYMEKHGEYPTPAHPDATTEISGKDMRMGGARMLYQVLTGDGSNDVKSASATGKPSDGKISEEESTNTINANIPKKMIAKDSGGYYLVDGWGRPFQYIKGGDEESLNPTYDLWSFGHTASKGPVFYDAENRRNVQATATWIKNW